MQVRRSTPMLIVDAIEPVLPFWRDRLQFSVTAEVAHAHALGFVILGNGVVELMYQTAASVRADASTHLQDWDHDRSFLYVEVDDVDAVTRALSGFEIVLPRRQTFYGATERLSRTQWALGDVRADRFHLSAFFRPCALSSLASSR